MKLISGNFKNYFLNLHLPLNIPIIGFILFLSISNRYKFDIKIIFIDILLIIIFNIIFSLLIYSAFFSKKMSVIYEDENNEDFYIDKRKFKIDDIISVIFILKYPTRNKLKYYTVKIKSKNTNHDIYNFTEKAFIKHLNPLYLFEIKKTDFTINYLKSKGLKVMIKEL
jgi:hypothetical protein